MEKLKARAKARAEKGGFSGLSALKGNLGKARRKSVDVEDEGIELLPTMVNQNTESRRETVFLIGFFGRDLWSCLHRSRREASLN